MKLAQISNPAIENLTGGSDPAAVLGKLISGIVGLLLIGATLWAFAQLLIGGINWISSSGDKGRLETAQQKILQALVGLFIVFAAWAIFILILNFLGLSIIGENGNINFSIPSLLE